MSASVINERSLKTTTSSLLYESVNADERNDFFNPMASKSPLTVSSRTDMFSDRYCPLSDVSSSSTRSLLNETVSLVRSPSKTTENCSSDSSHSLSKISVRKRKNNTSDIDALGKQCKQILKNISKSPTCPEVVDITTPPKKSSENSVLLLPKSPILKKRLLVRNGNLDDWIHWSSPAKKCDEIKQGTFWSNATPDSSPIKAVSCEAGKPGCLPFKLSSEIREPYKRNETKNDEKNVIVISDSPPEKNNLEFVKLLPLSENNNRMFSFESPKSLRPTCSPSQLMTEETERIQSAQIADSPCQKNLFMIRSERLVEGSATSCAKENSPSLRCDCKGAEKIARENSFGGQQSTTTNRSPNKSTRSPLRSLHDHKNASVLRSPLGIVQRQENTGILGISLRTSQGEENTVVLENTERYPKSSTPKPSRICDSLLSTSALVSESPSENKEVDSRPKLFSDALRNSSVVSYEEKSQHTKDLERIFLSPTFKRIYQPKQLIASRFDENGKVVRKKHDRELLHGFECKCCAGYYGALKLNAEDRLKRVEQVGFFNLQRTVRMLSFESHES